MEPTIYKPSIYKGAGIYKIGAEGGGGGDIELKKVYGQHKLYYVDSSGYIGGSLSNNDSIYSVVYNNRDFSTLGLGQVKFYEKKIGTLTINGLNFKTTTINNIEWISQNLDIILPGISPDGNPINEPCGIFFNYDYSTYGRNGKNYGRLYNKSAVDIISNELPNIAPGWRIATNSDFQQLYNDAGFTLSGQVLSVDSGGFAGWGTDDFEFNGTPAGVWANGFYNVENRFVYPLYDGTGKEWFVILNEYLKNDNDYKNHFCDSLRICRDVI